MGAKVTTDIDREVLVTINDTTLKNSVNWL